MTQSKISSFAVPVLIAAASGAALTNGGMISAARAQSVYPPSTGNTSTSTEAGGKLNIRLSTDRTQYPGSRPVQITLFISNTEYDKITINSGNKPEYDLVIRNARTDAAVWSLWKNRPGTVIPRGFTLHLGETRNHSQLWDQTDDTGARVPAGVYTIDAVLWSGRKVSTQVYLGGNSGNGNGGDNGGGGFPGQPGNGGGNNNGNGGNNGGNGDGNGNNVTDRVYLNGTLTSDRAQIVPGGTLRLTYTVTNPTRTTQTVRFRSGQQFDITATSPQGQVIWQQSRGMFYTQALGGLSLQPGQSRAYAASWPVPADLRSGMYTLRAYLGSQGGSSDESGSGAAAYAILHLPVGTGTGNSGGNGNGGGGGGNISLLSLRELASGSAHRLVGQVVTVSGAYLGLKGGLGAPPVSRTDWILAGDGVTVYVTGSTPDVSVGKTVTISGVLRRTGDGRHYIDARSR